MQITCSLEPFGCLFLKCHSTKLMSPKGTLELLFHNFYLSNWFSFWPMSNIFVSKRHQNRWWLKRKLEITQPFECRYPFDIGTTSCISLSRSPFSMPMLESRKNIFILSIFYVNVIFKKSFSKVMVCMVSTHSYYFHCQV